MGTFRLYTGSDGQSHIERIDLAKTPEWGKGLSTCSVEGCDRPVRGRGLCRRHYYRATGY